MEKTKRSRNWHFTDFSMNREYNVKIMNNEVRYFLQGREVCPETNREHVQGFVQFNKPKRWSYVQKFLGGCHFECMKSTVKDSIKYCKKGGNFTDQGKPLTQGQRSDLEQLQADLDDNIPMSEVASDHFQLFLRYPKGIQKYKELKLKEKTKKQRDIRCVVLSGETGVGKTKQAVEHSDNYYMITGDSLQWFDGYDGERTLIIDEYNNNVSVTRLLNLLDRYQLRLPVKGGFTYANWDHVIITTNLSRNELHPNAKPAHRRALDRRITEWHEVSSNSIDTSISVDF